MPRVYEMPTHVQVEDQLIAGLTARQLLRLMIGASLAYGLWDQLTWLPEDIRLALAAVLVVIGIMCALLQPGGRSLDQWLVACLVFAGLPRRLVWRPGATLLRQAPSDQAGWAELELHPEWLTAESDHELETSRPSSPGPPAFRRVNRARFPSTEAGPNGQRRWLWVSAGYAGAARPARRRGRCRVLRDAVAGAVCRSARCHRRGGDPGERR